MNNIKLKLIINQFKLLLNISAKYPIADLNIREKNEEQHAALPWKRLACACI